MFSKISSCPIESSRGTKNENGKSKLRASTSSEPTSTETEHNEPTSSAVVIVKPIVHNSWLTLNTASQSPGLEHNEDSSSSTGSLNGNTSFFQFFRGIHCDYLELPAKKQRRFKRECLNFLHELLDDEDDVRPIPDYSHQDDVLNLSNSGHVSKDDKDIKPVVGDGYILPNT
ncbi:uncharacterized protein LOC126771685 [Nymphalis io]|uniref:uncharacterized protein LOC126771685 n=1 Tax=Inachis io TaxID=171585 RepID=UPI0021681B7C|nr:uncharacterized protein LOC126771685 [Nymphalis io]